MKKMNKLFVALFVAGSFAMLLGSCKKNDTASTMNIGLPQFEEEMEGRAYIDITNSNSFKWNANDQVMVYNIDAADGTQTVKGIWSTNASAEGKATASFTGPDLGSKKDHFFVFYPCDKVASGEDPLDASNFETFNVPDQQEYTLVKGKPTIDHVGMAMACETQNVSSFTLKHIFGALKVKLTGTGKVTKIVVEDKRFNLSGNASMKLHAVVMDKFTTLQNAFVSADDPYNNDSFVSDWNTFKNQLGYSTQGGGKTMTLNCPSVQLSSTETLFFIGLRPGALKYGYKIYVYTEGANEPQVFENAADWHYGIKAGVIKNLALSLN
jgi:hypothetical protein